jgi:hypothetical protein
MSDTCKNDLPGSAVETIVLAFDLVGYELNKGPERVKKALESDAVQKAITSALQEQAKDFLAKQQKGEKVLAGDAAKQIAEGVGKKVAEAGGEEIKKKIQSSTGYQRLEGSLKDLKCAYEKSPIGVWVDEHKAVLIIVASGVALGAATAMYLTNTGDTPAGWATELAKDKIKTTVLGKLELGVSEVTFVPSKREVGMVAYVETKNWKAVQAKLSINVKAADEKLVSAGGALEVKVPLNGSTNWHGNFNLRADPVLKQYNLSLGITGKEDGWSVRILGEGSGDFTAGKYSLGANAGVGYSGKVGSIPFKLDATAGVGGAWQDQSKLPPGAMMGQPGSGLDGKVEAKVWVGISIPTPFQF